MVVSSTATSLRGPSDARLARRRALGWAVFGVTSVACGAALVLDLHTRTYTTLGYVAVAEALALIGVLLTTRIPEHRVSWVLAFSALGWAISDLAFAYAVEALVADPGGLPAGLAAAWLDNWAWLPGLALPLAAMLLLIPDGRLASHRWWPIPASVVAGTTLGSFAVSASPTFDLTGTTVANPLALDSIAVAAAGTVGAVLVVGGLVASLLAFAVRYRRSDGDERQQLRWVGVSLGLAVPLAVAGALLWGVVPGAEALPALAVLALPTGIALAVLKYRLYDLDLVLNRAVVYGVMTVAVIGGYVAVVGSIASYVSRRGDLVVSLVVTGVVAVCFQPVRERVQRSVNRLMYGERDDPYAAIARLGRTLGSATQLDTVLPAAVETIGRTLAVQYVTITAPGDEAASHPQTVAAYGTPGGDQVVFPLVHHGAPIGELRLTPRSGERFRERDRRLVADLAPHVAGALRAVTLSRELQATRERIVRLREEERRRIRRDLHDGLGPALAGLTFTLEAVRNVADSDLERADDLLVAATEQVQTMIGDIRRLIYGLRPPALDQLGLTGSLRGLATRETLPEIAVRIDAPTSLPALPAAVEVAAYWITQEALTNVKRHARARACNVRLAVEPERLRLEIEDDGAGLANGSTGIGLQTMKERAAEVGGTCEIAPRATGGTRVTASLPRPRTDEPTS
jgi:signal transduction histidine kinase